MPEEATLSNEKNYTVFQFNGHIIRFTAPYSLEYYTEVKEWDNGYLVVMQNISKIRNLKKNILILYRFFRIFILIQTNF